MLSMVVVVAAGVPVAEKAVANAAPVFLLLGKGKGYTRVARVRRASSAPSGMKEAIY